jgi:hypothetical protein
MSLIHRARRRQKSAREVFEEAELEVDFLKKCVDLAKLRGWLVYHARPAMDKQGRYSTPMQGDIGFPDLVLTRRGRLLIVELKREKANPTAQQAEWLKELLNVEHIAGDWVVHVDVWRPSMWDKIVRTLE